MNGMQRPKACPGCKSMYLRHGDIAWDWMWDREDHHEVLTWQCVNCGAVIHKGPYKLEIVRYDPIRLAPGELAGMSVTPEHLRKGPRSFRKEAK